MWQARFYGALRCAAILLSMGCQAALVPIVAAETGVVRVEQIVSDLKGPCGLVVQPRSNSKEYGILIAESAAGRVMGYLGTPPPPQVAAIFGAKLPIIIDGFDTVCSNTSKDQLPSVGPLCLHFLDAHQSVVHRLVVGTGGDKGGDLWLYEIGGRVLPVAADQPAQQVRLAGADHGAAAVCSIARTHANDLVADMLIVSCVDQMGAGKLWRIPVRADTLGEAELFAQHGHARRFARAVTVSPQGFVVAVEVKPNQANLLTFLNPADGGIVMQLPIELSEVVALAYSPRTGNLYAANFASGTSEQGGIYRLDEVGTTSQAPVAARKIAHVEKPTALGFASDGTLYVTALGLAGGDKQSSGRLLRISGEL